MSTLFVIAICGRYVIFPLVMVQMLLSEQR
jgi:hypothetical protein